MKSKDELINEVREEKKEEVKNSLEKIIKENLRQNIYLISLYTNINIELNSDYKVLNKNKEVVNDILNENKISWMIEEI